jgi:hypothetical protein
LNIGLFQGRVLCAIRWKRILVFKLKPHIRFNQAAISFSFFAPVSWFWGIDLLQAAFFPAAFLQGCFSLQIAIFTEPTAHHILTVKLFKGIPHVN